MGVELELGNRLFEDSLRSNYQKVIELKDEDCKLLTSSSNEQRFVLLELLSEPKNTFGLLDPVSISYLF